jgi:hypothetical protein
LKETSFCFLRAWGNHLLVDGHYSTSFSEPCFGGRPTRDRSCD